MNSSEQRRDNIRRILINDYTDKRMLLLAARLLFTELEAQDERINRLERNCFGQVTE